MYFGGFLRPKPGSRWLRMAIRATVTSVTAIIAAVTVESAALPRLTAEGKDLARPPAALQWLGVFQGHLRYVPVPALVLGVAAIAFRRFRPALALLAMVAAVASLIIIVGTTVAAFAPLYQAPRDLGL